MNGFSGTRTLVFLTGIFALLQLTFFVFNLYLSPVVSLFPFISNKLLFSSVTIAPLIQFLLAQLLINGAYLYMLWYLTVTLGSLFNLDLVNKVLLGIFIWLNSFIVIYTFNCYLIPQSWYATFTQAYLSTKLLGPILLFTLFVCVCLIMLALGRVFLDVLNKNNLTRHACMGSFLLILLALNQASLSNKKPLTQTGDYIVAAINDFPLSNLLLTTRIGKMLFPQVS